MKVLFFILYETFNSVRKSFGIDYFASRIDDGVVRNLNPKFELREYQKEALGRFDFYLPAEASAQAGFGWYQKRAFRHNCFFIWRPEAERRLLWLLTFYNFTNRATAILSSLQTV